MNKPPSFVRVLTLLVFASLIAGTASAQATRTWVSGVGDDVNPCSRTAPCKTFAGAISKTAINGEINCLDPGGFGAVTITKSITIDCHEVFASILHSGTTGIIINFDSFSAASDPQMTVRLRNLNLNGSGSGTYTGINGIRILGAPADTKVIIEDLLIEGNSGRGILDQRTGGGRLVVSNTTIRDNLGTAFLVLPASGANGIGVLLDNVRIFSSNYGFAISNGVRAQVNRSVFSHNTNAGLYADSFAGTSELNVNACVTSSNGVGVQNGGGVATIRLSDVDIFGNGTAILGTSFSFGTNRISGNNSVGTLPTPMGADTHAKGQQ